jgi:predicted enzyme related to lactoylglutathione lyase
MDPIVHFHLPVNEMERAAKFYESIFGWMVKTIPKHDQYRLINTVNTDENEIPTEPGAINGAFYVREEPSDCPELTIEVNSIENALKEIAKNGGKTVTQKTPVGDMGFYAEFVDTEGNFMGLWEEPKK